MSVFRSFRRTQERKMNLKREYSRINWDGTTKIRERLQGPTKGVPAKMRYPKDYKVRWVEL